MIEFDGTARPTGIEVYDPIEQRHLQFRTPEPVDPADEDPSAFPFPVDTSCTIETESLRFDQFYSLDVHDADGRSVETLQAGDCYELDGNTQYVGLCGPIKLYCSIDVPGRIETGINSIRVTLSRETTVVVGARSVHEQPAATITTPADPESMMRAVSALPSALKTTSPERSWPTLRGHPPLIELGSELEIPDVVAPPATDVAIEVPPTHRDLYAVTSLAFYLGADVRPGPEPVLSTGDERYALADGRPLTDGVTRALERTFFLDCLVRTEGLYRLDLHERDELEDALPFDLEAVYDAPLGARLERYLDVPYETLEPYVPRWPLTAHVPSVPDGVELLPFVANELGIVREPRGRTFEQTRSSGEAAVRSATSDQSYPAIVRSAGQDGTHATRRSAGAGSGDAITVVRPDVRHESIEHAWFGSHVPHGASKATIEAYRNQLSRGARSDSIEILVVCNDARMIGEHDVIDETYGNRETLPFDIRSRFGVSTDELAGLLADGGYDFLHYIGHATPDGLECPDGELDVRSLSAVDLGVFFLNACQSYEQGLALAHRGAFGGIATLGDIVNEHAVEIGDVMARLLNYGFPLRAALELARELSILGEQYLIVGDGSADIAQSDGGTPVIVELERRADGDFDFALRSYPTKEFKLGTATTSNLQSVPDRHLSPGVTPPTRVDEETLQEYLTWIEGPVLIDGEVRWNDGVGPIQIG